MRILKRLVLFLAVFALILAAAAYMLPREVSVERSVTIAAPPEAVFPYVNSLQRAAEWSPWLGIDPDLRPTYEGPAEGVGNRMTWSSDNPDVGSGSQIITVSVPNEHVESDLDFGSMGTANAWVTLDPESTGTRVAWGLNADMGNNPIGRWMGLMMDRWVGADYERGLSNLKSLVEGG
jgi:uncharacterized protein YndB with AHSA1/START domain